MTDHLSFRNDSHKEEAEIFNVSNVHDDLNNAGPGIHDDGDDVASNTDNDVDNMDSDTNDDVEEEVYYKHNNKQVVDHNMNNSDTD